MPGGTIADLMKRSGGKLDETTAAACVRGILEGLSYLHRKSIVHCDIKAKNILLGPAGEIKIADFGSAKRLSSSQNPEDRRMRGTPLWMAPEVLQGVEQETPSDIWSLGCTVIEMLHGRLPWQDKEGRITSKDIPPLLMRIACSKEISPPLKSSLSEQARDFLNRCLARDPSERWTAEQLLQHPFVKIRETSCWGHDSQPSPRSAFDFVSDSDSASESEGESESFLVIPAHDTVPSCHLARHKQANINDDSFVKDCSRVWHVMRCADNWLAEKQKPFFCLGEKLVFKKGSDVSFESVSFLTERVRSMRMS
ncbi:hypothetical protein KP509_37G033200 [Ceratopteris richardii]|uniref:Protein kinase domain-containing protein n=1 Tax=Ceratopteris richardii TaxID=49495 RepID=A0A8T2Q7S8_CERRI|nr:hypothetical protein KP509_37G033200 [Ceratopteris richardii]